MPPSRRLAAVPDAPRRAALYVRVSSLMGRAGETFHSPDLQLQAIRARLVERGMVEHLVVEDLDVSGRTMDRAGLDRLLAAVDAGEVDAVAVYDLSRLGRNTGETLRLISRLRDRGIAVVSATEQVDDTPEGQLMLTMWLGLAQHYSDSVGRRWKQVQAHRAAQGRWHGRPPLGYVRDEQKLLQPDPVLAPLITDVFRRYAAGEALFAIVRGFDARRTDRRPTWHGAVKRMLGNAAYVGQVPYAGRYFPGLHAPLVDETTFAAVQRRLARDATTAPRLLHPTHALSGLLVCDRCGAHLARDVRADTAGGPVVVRVKCARRSDLHPHGRCPGVGRPLLQPIEDAVAVALLELASRLRTDPVEVVQRKSARAVAGAELTSLRRELAKVEAAAGRLAVDYAQRDISHTAYTAAARQLEESMSALRLRVGDLELQRDAPTGARAARHAKALAQAWPRMTPEERNTGAKLLVRQVRVRPPMSYRQPAGERIEVLWL